MNGLLPVLPTLKAPVYVHMDLTKRCNFRCFYCNIRDNSSAPISAFPASHFQRILMRLAQADVFDVSFFGGEPFLYPHIFDLATYARDMGLAIGFLTNGSLIDEVDVKRVVRSFDAGAVALNGVEDVHDRMVGMAGAFAKADRLIKSLVKEGFEVAIDTVVSKSTVDRFDELLTYIGQNLDVEIVNINTFMAYSDIGPSEVMDLPALHRMLSVVDKHVKGRLGNRLMLGGPVPWCLFPKEYAYLANSCSPGWMFAGIDSFGDVRMCPWSSKVVGNLLEVPLDQIWQTSEELREYRAFSWSDPVCSTCAVRTYCLGGCHVTQSNPPYSLGRQWKPYARPLSVEEVMDLAAQPNPTRHDAGVQTDHSRRCRPLALSTKLRLRKEPVGYTAYSHQKGAYWLNDTSKEVLDLVAEYGNEDRVIQAVQRKYASVEPDRLKKDTRAVLSMLERMHFVVPQQEDQGGNCKSA